MQGLVQMGSLGFKVALVQVLHLEGHHRHRLNHHLVHHFHHRVLHHHHHRVQTGLVQMLLLVPVLGLSQLV